MREEFEGYWISLYKDIPGYIYVGMCAVLILAIIFIWNKYGLRCGWKQICRLLTIEYVLLIFCSTVIYRSVGRCIQLNLMPFWSYGAYFRGEDPRLLPENIMNVVVFIPVGLLLCSAFRGMTWIKELGFGIGISIGIELSQLIFKRGFCEIDDVMHNTLGCILGYGLAVLIKRLRLEL
jgi:glycopeptide antibiotics resistance protein